MTPRRKLVKHLTRENLFRKEQIERNDAEKQEQWLQLQSASHGLKVGVTLSEYASHNYLAMSRQFSRRHEMTTVTLILCTDSSYINQILDYSKTFK